MALKSIEFSVSGLVQGVGYRYFVKGVARAEGLVGWVKNDPAGHVIGMAQGDGTAVETLKRELSIGPQHAKVTKVEVKSETSIDRLQFSSFNITY
ncbi:uncharacterized protein PHACADRAFT_260087 [Phanerochaete carnosa HHB-10118-sp]|uniref:acylphosphatase n=1 Tax=Phanerochaete carnosa (strain HHB-10118-sp) TaxID=650164 RepID=K5W3W0_PHACS|nr:uncharacterized protein PHACADRAFT_260087 [Phanerochaete carnosa HHB-10118-sp]EKM53629.1 hypothetical protein PHACADRAFT_260087 [Phanerochaete carnosa HHB-10118-sp]